MEKIKKRKNLNTTATRTTRAKTTTKTITKITAKITVREKTKISQVRIEIKENAGKF
jgi:hypothetical protein